MKGFVALIRHEAGDPYRVTFPDFPGITVEGATLDDTLAPTLNGRSSPISAASRQYPNRRRP
jgi:hypothetical protein